MKWDNREPCKTCPYRKDVPIGTWHASEFTNLLEQDADTMAGSFFSCHQERKKPKEEWQPCIGWLLDQKKRRVPLIPLRVKLITDPKALECFEKMHHRGIKLFRSLKSMCLANLRAKPRRR